MGKAVLKGGVQKVERGTVAQQQTKTSYPKVISIALP